MSDKKRNSGEGGLQAGPGSVPIVLLAAGQGRRLGRCKPLARLGDRTLLERAIALLKPLTSCLVVVVGYQYLRVRFRTRIHPHKWAVNPDWAEGQSTSLQRGLGALAGSCKGALVCLVDQPAIPVGHYRELLRMATAEPGRTAATRAGGRLMAPAYIPRSLWPEVYRLRGDQGARRILPKDSRALRCEEAGDDIDTATDLLRHQVGLQF